MEKKNADDSVSDIRDVTSLLGNDKKRLLKEIPSKLDGILNPGTCQTVKEIWTSFNKLYSIISEFTPESGDADKIFTLGREWINLFCSLRGKRSDSVHAHDSLPHPYFH